jgi:hypothetical protein
MSDVVLRDKYLELIMRVKKLDAEAAAYMKDHATKLEDFEYGGDLVGCFVFKKTPQGHDYWMDIRNKLLGY